VDAGGLRFRIGNEAVRKRDRVAKRLGFTCWCSHDIDPAMKGFLSLEYTRGVLDQQNRVKPRGPTLSSLADQWRKNPPAVISRSVALVIPDKGLSKKRSMWPIGASRNNIGTWFSHRVRAAIVLESRAGDTAYRKTRGIEEPIEAAVR
jgi:hypothetical protein